MEVKQHRFQRDKLKLIASYFIRVTEENSAPDTKFCINIDGEVVIHKYMVFISPVSNAIYIRAYATLSTVEQKIYLFMFSRAIMN